MNNTSEGFHFSVNLEKKLGKKFAENLTVLKKTFQHQNYLILK